MNTNQENSTLKEAFQHTFAGRFSAVKNEFSEKLQELKEQAFISFQRIGFPTTQQEEWRNTNLDKLLTNDYTIAFEAPEISPVSNFECEFDRLDSDRFVLNNGWSEETGIRTTAEGVVVGSIRAAIALFPELVENHLGKLTNIENEGLNALNTAFFRDGIFIHVPDNVTLKQPLQLVNMCNSDKNLFVQPRNLVLIGKNSSVDFIQCDDSLNHQKVFSNAVTEIFVGEGSKLTHVKMQNINDQSAVINTINFEGEANSTINSYQLSFNGGVLRNDVLVNMVGKGADANILGLYLMDNTQHIDNRVYIKHAVSDCTSSQRFKGILDDYASASFNGHVYVAQDAQRTVAFQNSQNILLSDKAVIDAKPFLEIYADDVKCSHGATIGQIDEEAMFYLRSRGIGEKNARMLLMYAFAAEVITNLSLQDLKEQLEDMIKKRLRGELGVCEQCVLHCTQPEFDYDFKIDLSKI